MQDSLSSFSFTSSSLFIYVLKISQGHEDRFSVYVHASKEKPVHTSRFFLDREIRSEKVCTLLKIPIHLYTVYF